MEHAAGGFSEPECRLRDTGVQGHWGEPPASPHLAFLRDAQPRPQQAAQGEPSPWERKSDLLLSLPGRQALSGHLMPVLLDGNFEY